ncbi:galactose-3-O-sulfotransferase 3 [Aplochiton taeniatus]
MSQKKIFLVFIAISTVSLLLHHGGHFSWTMEALHLGCPVLRSHPSPGLKPKHTNVAFLKTHKTASSTMQNLLFRFAERNNLTVALPVQNCGHMFCYPSAFSGRFVHPHTLPANMVASHMRFGRAELRRLMPNDTLYVTIVREPASMFESLFSYFNQYCQSFKRVPNGSLEAFLDEPWRYYRPEEKDSMYARNTLTFDLGGDKDRASGDAAYARDFVAEVERVFALVMIAEHFDESLVLLRHLLSWDLDDVLYLKLNMRTPGSKRGLTPALAAKTRAWNHLDARLYDHFNASLWRRLEALGTACVAREVRLLRRAQERLTGGCFGGRPPPLRSAAQIKNKELRPWKPSAQVDIVGYDPPVNLSRGAAAAGLTHELCLRLIMPELQYTRLLLRSQSLRYRHNYPLRPPPAPQQPLRSVLPRHQQVGVHRSQAPPPPAPGPGSGLLQGSTDSPRPAGGTQGRTTRVGLRASQTQAS